MTQATNESALIPALMRRERRRRRRERRGRWRRRRRRRGVSTGEHGSRGYELDRTRKALGRERASGKALLDHTCLAVWEPCEAMLGKSNIATDANDSSVAPV